MKLIHVLPCIVALSLSSMLSGAAENELANSGFESGVSGWELLVPPESKGKVETPLQVVTDNAYEGKACSETTVSEFARFIVGNKASVTVAPGNRYLIRAWVRIGEGSAVKNGLPLVYIRLTPMNPPEPGAKPDFIHIGLSGAIANNANLSKLAPSEESSAWRKIEGVVQIPQDMTTLRIHLITHGVSGKVYWDDVTMEKVSPQTPLSKNVMD